MKKIVLYSILLGFTFVLKAQNGVGINTTNPDDSAILDITSTTQGLLINRVALSNVTDATTPINAPATGLLVYNTNASVIGGAGEGFYYFNGSAWTAFKGSTGWSLNGNTGTTPATNFIGTGNSNDLVISTNGTEAARVLVNGNIGIGTTNPAVPLHVEGTAIPSVVYSMDFEGSLASVSQSDNAGVGNWGVTSTATSECSFACTNNVAYIGTTNVSDDDLLLGPFQSFQTLIDISFNYGHIQPTTGSSKNGDIFRVELLQAGVVVQTLVNLIDTTVTDQTFSTTGITVTPGIDYYLRATLIDRYGAAIDNILVTQASSSVLRIEDGNEQQGYVLTSDANGFGTWRDPKIALAEEDWSFFSGSTNNDGIYHRGLVRVGGSGLAIRTLDINYGLGTTTFGLGSVEQFKEGVNEIIGQQNDIAPQIDNTNTLGSPTLAWSEVFVKTATIFTSDERLKENMNPLAYGIKDLMKLKPSQYYWKDKHYLNRGIPLSERRKQLGLIAQELLEIVPEVVTTHQWTRKSEKEHDTFILKENERLGVNYAELIPVLVKATQDQQKLIEDLKMENERLEALALEKGK